MMSKPKDFSVSKLLCYRFFCLSAKLKRFISYVALALILVNNTSAVAQAQKLNNNQAQNSSTSPNYVAPQRGVTVNETPSCSNNITFSEYSLDTAITNQYGNKGIVFGGSSPFITTDGANPTSPVLSGSPRFFGAIEGSFVNPKDGVTPAIASSFQLDAGYFDSVGSTALKLYDSEGNLIEQRTNTGEGIFTFTVEGLPVAKWRLEPIGDDPAGFAIDNVCFTLLQVKESAKPYPEFLRDNGVPESELGRYIRESKETYSQSSVLSQSQDDESYDDESYNEGYFEPEIPTLQSNTNSTTNSDDDSGSVPPQSIAELSCAGIGTPLSTEELIKLSKQIKPNATPKQISDAFEAFALDSQGLRKYDERIFGKFDSPERGKKTKSKRTKVVPDAVSDVVTIEPAPSGYGPPLPRLFLNSTFWDAKVLKTGKSERLSESRYQPQGFLDYLSHYSMAAQSLLPRNKHPRGHLIYMTPAGVGVSSGIQNYTGETPNVPFTPVAVYQMVACLKDTGGKPTKDYLQMGYGILLNADFINGLKEVNGKRFTGYPFLFAPLPAGRPSSLKFPP